MYEEGARQVYQKLGVSSRGSIDVGNCIHIRSVSQLKKDAHNKPREELSIGAGQYWWNQAIVAAWVGHPTGWWGFRSFPCISCASDLIG